MIAGHYEGIDERVIEKLAPIKEISIGDYVLSGGELPAMVLIDSIVRLQPGALGDEQSAEEWLDRTEAAPVHVEGLQLRTSGADTSIQGRVVGNAAEPGTPIRLRFTFYGAVGVLGTEPLTLSAPPAGVRATFEVTFAGQATAYRYELVSAATP